MALDLLIFGEALVEVMRTEIDQPLNRPGAFIGPYPSGAPFIFAVQAARLGCMVGAVGSVGNDAFGQCLLDQLESDGITKSGVRVLDTHTTGVAFVAYNRDGSRSFVFSLGAGGELTPDMVDASMFEGLRCLHLMGSTLSMSERALETGLFALKTAQAKGVSISFDPNLRPELMSPEKARDVFAPFMDAADILIPTEEELLLLTGESSLDKAVTQLLAQKPQRVIVVTQGARGCTVYDAQGTHPVAGFTVDEVDPTGAGDCFVSGFLAGWLRGDSTVDAARLANACGALAVTKQGPMAGAEKLAFVEAFMAKNR